jgi:acyl-coenzyme A thioesterase PaaI-like protein
MRWMADEQCLRGVARFGSDCEGPEGHAHGGAIATVADAATATAAYKAAGRWGLTTKLECNYREMLPTNSPVQLEVRW